VALANARASSIVRSNKLIDGFINIYIFMRVTLLCFPQHYVMSPLFSAIVFGINVS
jgi:hypothetical protein